MTLTVIGGIIFLAGVVIGKLKGFGNTALVIILIGGALMVIPSLFR